METVDALVFPEGGLAGGGQRGVVEVVGGGVDVQKDETLAIGAVHPEFQAVEAALLPFHVGMAGLQFELEDGLGPGGVHRLLGPDDVEGLTDGDGVARVFLDARDQRGETGEDARQDRIRRGPQRGGGGERSHGGAGAVAGLVLEGGPLLGRIRIGGLRAQEVIEVGGVVLDAGNLGGYDADGGGVGGNFTGKVNEPIAFAGIIGGHPEGFGHKNRELGVLSFGFWVPGCGWAEFGR